MIQSGGDSEPALRQTGPIADLGGVFFYNFSDHGFRHLTNFRMLGYHVGERTALAFYSQLIVFADHFRGAAETLERRESFVESFIEVATVGRDIIRDSFTDIT